MTDAELVDLLRENYWYLEVTGARAMMDLWSDVAEQREGFEETMGELGLNARDFVRGACLLAEWFAVNDLLYKSPMEQSMGVRAEKLKFPEGPW